MKTIDLRYIAAFAAGAPRAVTITRANGQPARNPQGEQLFVDILQFFLERMGDAAFIGNLKGYDAAEFVFRAREQLRAQCAKDDGLLVLEDQVARGIVDATLKPKTDYNTELLHNFWPFIQAVKAIQDGDCRINVALLNETEREVARA